MGVRREGGDQTPPRQNLRVYQIKPSQKTCRIAKYRVERRVRSRKVGGGPVKKSKRRGLVKGRRARRPREKNKGRYIEDSRQIQPHLTTERNVPQFSEHRGEHREKSKEAELRARATGKEGVGYVTDP